MSKDRKKRILYVDKNWFDYSIVKQTGLFYHVYDDVEAFGTNDPVRAEQIYLENRPQIVGVHASEKEHDDFARRIRELGRDKVVILGYSNQPGCGLIHDSQYDEPLHFLNRSPHEIIQKLVLKIRNLEQ